MPDLLYALNRDNILVHVDSVPNGLACQCHCPGCGETVVAKNNGETKAAHFAHYFGTVCKAAHESELHMLAKAIINETKAVMLPPYGRIFKGGQQRFDRIEVEERNDIDNLQPDICGIVNSPNGKESRLWIEIRVTHAIGTEKRELIRRNNIACMEINLSSFIDRQVNKEELTDFLLNSMEGHEWTNNPVLELRQKQQAEKMRTEVQQRQKSIMQHHGAQDMSPYEFSEYLKEQEEQYLNSNPDTCIQKSFKCLTCIHHSTRKAIYDEISRRRLPSWLREALRCDLSWLDHEGMRFALRCSDGQYIFSHQNFLQLLPTSSPDIYGATVSQRVIRQNKEIIPFLQNIVPDIIALHSLHCSHNKHSFPTLSKVFDIVCDCPNVVNKHRRTSRRR